MAPAFLTTPLHPATASFRFSAGARGCSRPHWAPTAAPASLSPAATPAVPRRLLLPVPVAAGIWDLISGGAGGAAAASLAVRRGMQLFRQGDVAGSLAEFDKAIKIDSRQKQYLWQRGLSLYYLDRFEEGAEQFRIDVAANPNDTEESIWCFLCEAQLYGIEEARKRFLEVGLDSRPVMREAYALFKDGGDPEKVISAEVTMSIRKRCRYGEISHCCSMQVAIWIKVRRLHGFPCICPLPVSQLESSMKEITIFKRTQQFSLDPANRL